MSRMPCVTSSSRSCCDGTIRTISLLEGCTTPILKFTMTLLWRLQVPAPSNHLKSTFVEGPHDALYGMRAFIKRDLNGFCVTFGQPRLLGSSLAFLC